jgi:hypothetical protein
MNKQYNSATITNTSLSFYLLIIRALTLLSILHEEEDDEIRFTRTIKIKK